MTKLLYLLRAPASLQVEKIRDRVLGELTADLLKKEPARLKVTLTSVEPPRLSIIPFRRERLVLVSLWDRAAAEEATGKWNEHFVCSAGWSGYRVCESEPRTYLRNWPDGIQTPGIGMLTLLRRRPGLSDQVFLERWHEGHSALALQIHPLWNYVRNVVEGEVVAGSQTLDGIVEEHFRTSRDLLNPALFFGGWLRMVPNMVRVGLDVHGFLDLSTLENYLVTEHWLKS